MLRPLYPDAVSASAHHSRAPRRPGSALTSIDLFDFCVWAVRDQRADRDDVGLHEVEIAAMAKSAWRTSTCGCAAVARIGQVGCAIDGSGQVRGVAPRVHEDAERLVTLIRRLPREEQVAVLTAARRGTAPEPFTEQQTLLPVESSGSSGFRYAVEGVWEEEPQVSTLAAAGFRLVDDYGRRRFRLSEPGYQYRTTSTGTRFVFVRWCPIQVSPDDAWVEGVNREYDTWHAGMMRLLGEAAGYVFTKHKVRGFRYACRAARGVVRPRSGQ